MRNIAVVGVGGSGVNFLKNIFLLSDKLRIDVPFVLDTPITDRYLFITDYYKSLREKTDNSQDWLEHEWTLRMSSHWTDEFNETQCLIKINPDSPTVFVLHHEQEILIDDPIDVVAIVIDDKNLCDKFFQIKVKSSRAAFKNFSYDVLIDNPHPRRTYHTILFSDLLKNPLKIAELTNSLNLDINLDKIETIHQLWIESNKILLANEGITIYDL